MPRVFPASVDSLRERRVVCATTLLAHVFFVCLLLRNLPYGVVGPGEVLKDDGGGELMVVEFVALPSKPPKISLTSQRFETSNAKQSSSARLDIPTTVTDSETASFSGKYTPTTLHAPSVSSASTPSSVIAPNVGNLSDEFLSDYHAAIRARIAQTWHSLTDRAFPTDCVLRLSQSLGGAVTATSANGCKLSDADRLQLESAALMAQPLPYAGYEAVFTQELLLKL